MLCQLCSIGRAIAEADWLLGEVCNFSLVIANLWTKHLITLKSLELKKKTWIGRFKQIVFSGVPP